MSFFQNHSGWPLVPLKKIATLKRGYDLPVGARNEGAVPIYAANGKNGAHDEVKIKGPGVITGRSGTIGKVHYCEEGFWPLNTALYVMDFHGNHPRWVYYMLSAFKLERFSEGAGVPTLNRNLVHDELIPLPPLPEQKRIAAILDKADAIRRKRQQAIQLADDFLRAVFLDMFGDPVTNPKGWDLLPFSAVGTLDRGKSRHRPRNDPALLGGAHPLIQTGEVANSRGYIKEHSATYSDLGLAQSKKWDAGTLCITIAANIAKTGILTFPACFPDSVVGFIPNKHVTVEYVQHWLGFLQKNLEENAPQAAQKNINLEILRALLIPVPPKSEQEKFSSMVAGILTIEEKIASSSDALGNAFDALSQKAFSGQL
ncbi:MAG: restriction endonuclease subunit S [Pseudomonas sp.]|uniref:restriction endonuclease subunit S n=1 Tax=Ectopseudomonas guguanensis TaxID=1198456 RepID=UPI0012D5D7AC|nr:MULTISPECIES: restriction endonuclease subunit S [Pseudomonas]HBN9503703.1 restriction endonuclease subunit S [Pseudomonas aeruginosa]MPT19773.1 restriction endonuclease subunit S [Pseudomonas sp.]WJH54850.1 restriction endonuclease subunit S [Pseudomonas guguanensis]HBN9529198.1 restriction endonuclease subunit S [Pseudomonas aeruginosa]HBN9754745.1 restriction endonuclease subunit S [Pseudomonas aeruginosa]